MTKITLQAVSYLDEDDYAERNLVLLDWKKVWFARDLAGDCPEDATLGRDMTNARQIIDLMLLCAWKDIEILPPIHCETFDEFNSFDK